MCNDTQKRRTALVVDDSMLIRHSVCRFLEARGFEVQAATNGVEALDTLAEFRPDVIITDLSMPKMDGSHLIAEIRRKRELADTPVLVLAAKRSARELAQDLPTTANAVIFKDIDIDQQLDRALEATSLLAVRHS